MNTTAATLVALLALPIAGPVLAQHPLEREGFFAGLSAGVSSSDARPIGRVEKDEDATHGATRLWGGYWFSRHWGAEAGYTYLGRVERPFADGTFRGSGQSLHVSGLGRLPFGERWALVGKLTLAATRVKDDGSTGNLAGYDRLKGSAVSLVPGIALEYALSDRVALTLQAESAGRAGRKLDLGYTGVGLRYAF